MSDNDGRRDGVPSDEERAPLRNNDQEVRRGANRRDNRAPGSPDNRVPDRAVLEIRTFFEERFNQLLTSNRRTQRQLEEQELTRKPLTYPGNEMQVVFNSKLLSVITESLDLLRSNSPHEVEGKLRGMERQIKERIKLIRLADRSPGGWDTVREYQDDDLADDSADEKRIRNAESRALAKKKKKESSSSSRFHPYNRAANTSNNALTGDSNVRFRNAPRRDSSFVQSGQGSQPGFQSAISAAGYTTAPRSVTSTQENSQCFGCGEFGHWRRFCPKLRVGSAPQPAATVQQDANQG